MTALLLEDEIIASNRLQRLLAEIDPDLEIVATFTSIQETANYLFEAAVQPDILFLDIHVLDGNSMELFKLLDITSKVIFTTAYDEYAVEAFRKNATDYLLKPIKKDQLVDAISKAKPTTKALIPALPEEQYKSRFLIRFGNKIKSIKTEEIASEHRRKIQLQKANLVIRPIRGNYHWADYSAADAFIRMGYDATNDLIGEIRAIAANRRLFSLFSRT